MHALMTATSPGTEKLPAARYESLIRPSGTHKACATAPSDATRSGSGDWVGASTHEFFPDVSAHILDILRCEAGTERGHLGAALLNHLDDFS
jgi:hypothetical protein